MSWDGFKGEVKTYEDLSRHTYFKIGGRADVLVRPQDLSDLEFIFRKKISQIWIMGAGSNLLISDDGLRGLVVQMDRFDKSIQEQPDSIRVGAGCETGMLLREAARNGWSGFDWMVGIPGTVGGMVAMNAGTFLGEMKDQLLAVSVFNLQTGVGRQVAGSDLIFAYRKNLFLQAGDLVVSALLKKSQGESAVIQQKIQELLKRRKEAQPVDLPCCGSVFKNPPQKSAWQVVDQLGLRGFTIGQAQISTKHSNFIVNLGGAQASDVRELIELIRSRALSELNIELEPEVKFFYS